MKIELIDRKYWLEKAEKVIEFILQERKKEDKEYEQNWRKRKFLPDRKDTEFPPNDIEYPSYYAYGAEKSLIIIKQALTTNNTGIIYIDGDELKYLMVLDNRG